MPFLGDDYFYGAYIKFVLNGSGGGSEEIPATAQTGDLFGIVLISLMIIALLATAVFAFVKRNSLVGIAKSISAKSGFVASSISNHRVIVAAIIAIGILLIAGITFSSKAFAESNEYAKPAAPPFKTVEASMDASTKTVSIPTVNIVDNLQPEGASAPGDFWPGITSFSIKPLNGINIKDLGTWTVYLDGKKVYEGSATNTIDWYYVCENKGQCSIDISVSGLSDAAYNSLNGQTAVVVQFGAGQPYTEESKLEETYTATVNLANSGKSLEYENYESFYNYMCVERGWGKDGSSDTFTKEFPVRTSYDEILSDWQYALDNGMFKSESVFDFYNWVPDVNRTYSKMLFCDETLNPVWYPEEKIVSFTYIIKDDVKTTEYWEQVKIQHPDWVFEKHPEFDASTPKWQIRGTISNRKNIDELNFILNQDCFAFENSTFNGWETWNKMIFDITPDGNPFEVSALLDPILVTVNGNLVDNSGNPLSNVTVSFEPRTLAAKESKLPNSMLKVYTTTTDENGNYIISCPKGKTGIFRFGGYYYSTTENDLVGESIIVENIQQQTLATVVLKQKATLKVTVKIPKEEANVAKLDTGMIKFITNDSSGNQKVFYAENWDPDGYKIEVFANVSGKIVYESSLRYGEINVENTGTGTSEYTVNVSMKTPDMSDCKVSGQVVIFDSDLNYVPLANAKVQLIMRDAYVEAKKTITVEIETDANGYYELNSFQNLYVEEAIYWDPSNPSEKLAEMKWSATFLHGDAYTLNITLYVPDVPGEEVAEAA